MKILITGAGGLVGRALNEHCRAIGDEVFGFAHRQLDISDLEQVERAIADCCPDAVINCAAWTDVDGCESDPERAHKANTLGPQNLANACRKYESLLITISTDYVFDGTKSGFYTQRDNPNPLSVYARSKLAGEYAALEGNARTIVVRSGFIFGPGGKNFLSNVIDLAKRGGKLSAIGDCWGTPTYSKHLASRLRDLVSIDIPGIYHVVNSGPGMSYEEFAREALRFADIPETNIEVISNESLRRPAPRPVNSKLKCLLSPAIGLPLLPSWREGLMEFAQTITKEQI